MAVVDGQGTPLADQTPRVGARCMMQANMPKPTKVFDTITAVDHTNRRVAWIYAGGMPAWALACERWQAVSVVDDGGTPRTLYESREVFTGVLAYFVKWFVGAAVTAALKTRAEAT
jgi:hypothetical protein